MGLCSCCPLTRSRKASADSLSMATQNPSLDVELPPATPSKSRVKKFNNSQINMLKKQESVYFKQNHRLKLDTDSINSKIIPLITPTDNQQQYPLTQHPPHLHAHLLSTVKEKLKPQLQKRSTMDEETSRENHYNNRDNFSDSDPQQESFTDSHEDRGEGKGDMTFSGRQESVALGRQFRTNQEAPQEQANAKEEIEKMEGKLKEGVAGEERCELLHRLAKCHCGEGNYEQGQRLLEQAVKLIKDLPSTTLKFDVFSLLGCVLLLREQPLQAITLLIKAVRLEVAGKGADSVRLVEPYYWLGEAYVQTRRGSLAKEYLLKSQRGYAFHGLHDPPLLQNIHLQLGQLYHSEQEFPEADKHYAKGIKAAEQTNNADKYLQLLLRRAENYYAMENYRMSVSTFASVFRTMRKHNLTGSPIYAQAKELLTETLRAIVSACISQNELLGVIKNAEECIHDLQQLKSLRYRLKKMRAILYRQ